VASLKETFAGFGGGAFALLLGATASAASTWLSEGRSLNTRVLIAFGFGLIGAVAAATVWYLTFLAVAPYCQRDAARRDLAATVASEDVLGAIADRLQIGVELKKFAERLSMNQRTEFDERFETWDKGNVEMLEHLAPTSYVEDYRFAEEPIELFETRTTGSFTDKYLPAEGQVEVKLRSLREIRDRVRTERWKV
jgi:hypothetical protein